MVASFPFSKDRWFLKLLLSGTASTYRMMNDPHVLFGAMAIIQYHVLRIAKYTVFGRQVNHLFGSISHSQLSNTRKRLSSPALSRDNSRHQTLFLASRHILSF